ncbi:putative reverse transcriptase domain-containing protein [Tanacetum coccineum]
MDEAHATKYSVHPRADKMYYDLRYLSWWPGMKKDISTYVIPHYHPKLYGQEERTCQTLEDMIRAYAIDFGGNWDTHLPLEEFSHNCSTLSLKCSHLTALYRRIMSNAMSWAEVGLSASNWTGDFPGELTNPSYTIAPVGPMNLVNGLDVHRYASKVSSVKLELEFELDEIWIRVELGTLNLICDIRKVET